MGDTMKRILAFAAALLIASPALAQTYPAHQGRPVIDAANVIPADREARLNQSLLDYERRTGHQLAVATVPSLGERDIETYAEEYFERLALGQRDVNDGVLFLVAPNERQMRIEVGYGLEPVLTDAAAALIIQNIAIPEFKSGNMVGGIENGAAAVMSATNMTAADIADMKQRREAAALKQRQETNEAIDNFFGWVFGLIATGLAAWGLTWVVMIPARRKRRRIAAEIAAIKELERLAAEAERERLAQARREQAIRDRKAAEAARVRAEKARQKAAAAAEERERQRIAAEKAARQAMLDSFTPEERKIFLANEREVERQRLQRIEDERRRERERVAIAAAAAAAAEAERQRQWEAGRPAREAAEREKRRRDDEERRRRADEDRRRRQREDDDRRSSSSWSSSDSSSSSSSWSGGGGDSGGGGASGSW